MRISKKNLKLFLYFAILLIVGIFIIRSLKNRRETFTEQNLTAYLNSKGFTTDKLEGYSAEIPQQIEDLIKLTKGNGIEVMEIGFNAGHSAETFLKNNPSLKLTSFDIGEWDYVSVAKNYIDSTYPSRHTLILGDSTKIIPEYTLRNNKKFDVIFIDGGHDYEIANADLKNCMKLAHKDTLILIDDTIYTPGWEKKYTLGPTKAWTEYVEKQIISEIKRVEYSEGRGMSWGKYIL